MSSRQNPKAVYNIIAFIFADRKTAKQVSDELKRSGWIQNYKIIADAVVEMDEKGKAHIHEGGHGGIGATGGAVFGGLLELIGGPAGLLAWAVAGSVIGGFAGHYAARVIPKEDLDELAAQMKPNTSAILAIVEDKEYELLIASMTPYQGQVVTLTVGDEASGEIAQAVVVDATGPVVATPAVVAAQTAAPDTKKPAQALSKPSSTAPQATDSGLAALFGLPDPSGYRTGSGLR
jgi:uncharacterized membrane protein